MRLLPKSEQILGKKAKIECFDNIYRSAIRYYHNIVSEWFGSTYDSFVDVYIEGVSCVDVSDVFNTGEEAAKVLVNECAKEYVGNYILSDNIPEIENYIDVYVAASTSTVAKVARTIKKMYTEEDIINILTDSLTENDVLDWFKNSKYKK